MELVRTVGRNTLATAGATLTNYGTKLFIAPLAIHYLGLGGFGVWAIVVALVNYTRVGIEGTEAACQKYVAESTATGDFELASRLLSTAVLAIVSISAVIAVPLCLWSDAFVRLAGVPEDFHASASTSVGFLAVAIIFANVGGIYRAIIMGAHRVDIPRGIEMVSRLIEGTATVILLVKGAGLFALTVPFAASEVVRCFIYAAAARRVLPEVSIHWRHVSRGVLRELTRYAGTYHVQSTLEMLYLSVMPIVILRLFGATTAGVYAACARLADVAVLFPESLLLPLLSGGSLVAVRGSRVQLRAVVEQALRAAGGLALPVFIFLAAFGDLVFRAWTGKESDLVVIGLRLICVAGLLRAFSRVCVILYRTTGAATRDLAWMMLRLVTLVASGFVGWRLYGFYGVLGGAVLAELVGLIFMLVSVHRSHWGPDWGWVLENLAKVSAVATAVVTLSFLVVRVWHVDSRLDAIGASLAGFALFLLPTAALLWRLLGDDERHAVRAILPQGLAGSRRG